MRLRARVPVRLRPRRLLRRELSAMNDGADSSVQALLRWWEAMRSRVVSSLRARGHGPEDAQDLFGEALLRAAERRDHLHDLDAAEAWFWQLAHRLAIDEHRRQTRRPLFCADGVEDLLTAPPYEPPQSPCACSVAMLEELPDASREILQAVDLGGSAVQDYARDANITANNASVRLYRARKALRDRLYDTCQTTSVAECMDCGCE